MSGKCMLPTVLLVSVVLFEFGLTNQLCFRGAVWDLHLLEQPSEIAASD